MPATITQHRDILEYKADLIYRGKTVTIALSSAALDGESSVADCFNSELSEGNGYERHSHTFDVEDGTYQADTKELSLPELNYTITAEGSSLQWQSAFVSSNGRILVVVSESSPVTLMPGQSYTYNIVLSEARI